MRGLRLLVVVMGIMIVIGTSVVILTIAHRLKGEAGAAAPAGHAVLTLPAGARIEDMAASGPRLVLRVIAAGGKESLIVIDPASGRLIETIAVRPGGG